jgi:hypothetical protein
MSRAFSELGVPSTGGSAPHTRGGTLGYGLFAVPTGIQRLYEFGLFSSGRIAAGVNLNSLATVRLFTYSQTQPGPGYGGVNSSVSETNMVVGGFAPGGETYEVQSCAVELFGDANVAPLAGDLRAMMRLGVVLWEFGLNTVIPISPISMIGAGGGLFGTTADTATPQTVLNNGNGGLWMYQNVVIAIPATQPFAVQFQWGSAGQAAAITLTNASQFRCTLFNMSRNAVPVA